VTQGTSCLATQGWMIGIPFGKVSFHTIGFGSREKSLRPAPRRNKASFMRFHLLILVFLLSFAARAQEPVSFSTQDGGLIQAQLYRAGEHGVVLVHGGRFNKESWEKQARALTNAGFTALAIDLRGYGKSKGPGDTDLFTAPLQNDVLAAFKYLQEHGSKKISLLGASLGGGAVAEASARIDSKDLAAVILLAATPDHPEKMRGRKFFIIAREDIGSGAAARPGQEGDADDHGDRTECSRSSATSS